MSKNISNLSGRVGLKDNLFKKMSENVLNDSPKDIKEIAKEYNLIDAKQAHEDLEARKLTGPAILIP